MTNRREKQKTNSKMVGLNLTLSKITLNINELNPPIKFSALILLGLKARFITADHSFLDSFSFPGSQDTMFIYISSYLISCAPSK